MPGTNWKGLGLKGALFVERSRYAVALINTLFEDKSVEWEGVHETALIAKNVK